MNRTAIVTLVAAVLVGCSGTGRAAPSSAATPTSQLATLNSQASRGAAGDVFPTDAFAALGEDPVSDELAAELQDVLDTAASGHGLTATVISPAGMWSGASGRTVTGERAMLPGDQMAIASITKTIVAAQVLQLVEAGTLHLHDLAADRLPPDLEFDTNGARIVDLLSMRSGIPDYLIDDDALVDDPMHVWTVEEKLATVAPERGPVGQDWEYTQTNYLLLGLIIEHVTGRSVGEVLRSGVLAGDGYERLIYQPDERPTEPMAMALEPVATVDAYRNGGGYLPSLAVVTIVTTAGAMASDSMSVARWFRALCAGQIVSPASVQEMTDFAERPGYGLGIVDRSGEYWPDSGALGHQGGNITVALCFQNPVGIVAVFANDEHDVDTVAGLLMRAASTASP